LQVKWPRNYSNFLWKEGITNKNEYYYWHSIISRLIGEELFLFFRIFCSWFVIFRKLHLIARSHASAKPAHLELRRFMFRVWLSLRDNDRKYLFFQFFDHLFLSITLKIHPLDEFFANLSIKTPNYSYFQGLPLLTPARHSPKILIREFFYAFLLIIDKYTLKALYFINSFSIYHFLMLTIDSYE
jgi:hypothetical protein